MGARGPWPNIDSARRAAGSHWAESEARSRRSGRTDPHLPEGRSDSPLRAPAHRRRGCPRRRSHRRARTRGDAARSRRPRPPRRAPPGEGAQRDARGRGRRRLLPRWPPPGVTAGWETAAGLRGAPRPAGGPPAPPSPASRGSAAPRSARCGQERAALPAGGEPGGRRGPCGPRSCAGSGGTRSVF